MSNHQSYRDVIVTNNPALLRTGDSTKLAAGQIGIFDYDVKKDRVAVYPPNFAYNKAIQIIQGTPEIHANLLGAIANETTKTKPIKGKKIISWTGKAAERGHNQVVAIGYDGVDTSKTISAKCEENKTVWIKLSGGPIDQIFHTEGRGYVRQFELFSGCCDDCADDCSNVNANAIADDLVNQINNDPILGLGTRTGNKLIVARKVLGSSAPTPDATCTEYLLSVCDSGDDTSLGAVQTQVYANAPELDIQVTRKSRTGSISVYSLIQDSSAPAPDAFSNAGLTIISDCPECPAGYTLYNDSFVYKIRRADAGDATALTTLNTDYGIAGSGETGVRLSYDYGTSSYVIVSAVELDAANDTDVFELVGETRNSCVITTPTEIDWVAGETLNRFNKTYKITLADNVCGENRLADLQAAYPDFTVSVETAGECASVYNIIVPSDCVPENCPADIAPTWVAPQAFEGITWVEVPVDLSAEEVVGVLLESIFIDRVTGECAYDYWSYDAEPIFLEVSQHSNDYNARPTTCANEWPITEIQSVKLPIGVGSKVREEEAFFKGYRREFRDPNPIVREAQNSILQTDPHRFYDQYTLAYQFSFHQSWFSEVYHDHYRLEIYFPEGQGKEFEAAINAYVSSIGIDLDPVVL